MCEVLPLQPAGAFLRQSFNSPLLRFHSDFKMKLHPQDEQEDFLTTIRRGIDELGNDGSDNEDSDDDSDDDGYFYKTSNENTYYSPDSKVPGDSFLFNDASDFSSASTASSSLTRRAYQFSDDESDDTDNLIFRLEM
ncbi:uncharacterized protein PHALS_01147 [Plasmopara halstedii]|uniref:Uncharacterized protein n=1 Tax=Plasmopara halstedii TaxID=4781 RepID=A0A0N7L6P0_PLAHL|nr:uncharacterized protein PHALS_01147 [Plasmopara halstedii]CEG44811.1 hypothetical protein PHALS_01147 [Plasmopara halstedii]|eukprot:XP_024581180.1 hypothetical protein PHALS_01147 [Plasmopara halstedii]